MNKRKCPHCKEYNKPDKWLLINNRAFCNYDHAAKYGISMIPKTMKKLDKKRKNEYYKTHKPTRKKAAVTWCNKWILIRDKEKPCKSCGCPPNDKSRYWHAGHYIPAGRCEALRFDERNIHKQCNICNDGNKGSGNLIEYRKALVLEFGAEFVEELEEVQPIMRRTAEDYKEIEEYYKNKIKELE